MAILAVRSQISGPEDRIVEAFNADVYNADNFSIDLGLLFLIGCLWRVATLLRMQFAKSTV
jgi:hypothetical protein